MNKDQFKIKLTQKNSVYFIKSSRQGFGGPTANFKF